MKITSVTLLFLISSFFTLVSCSQEPSIDQRAKEVFIVNHIQAENEGLYKIITMSKIDGIKRNYSSMQAYTMIIKADIEFNKDCYYYIQPVPSRLSIFTKKEWVTSGTKKAKKGERVSIEGAVEFYKTEKGWQS